MLHEKLIFVDFLAEKAYDMGITMSYDHKAIEAKWQKRWKDERVFEVDNTVDAEKKKYILDMFPYPSGAGLHVGHPEGYTATDIYSRYLRMKGFSVLHPMGWDAFGLPAENYAIKSGVHPKESTEKNIETFTRQIQSLGFSYDWSREVNTSSPEYYRWTQWIFLQLYKAGLAYKKEAPVNWCDDCQTVLANEQVVDGKCERCGHEVIQKNLAQWFFKITGNSSEFEGDSSKKTNYVILHGYTGSPDSDFHPWLKSELEARGYSVQVPLLPNTDNPTVMEQVSYVLENCTFDEHTIVLGHSLGAVVALKVLETLNKPIQKLVLAAGFIEAEFLDKERPFKDTFDWSFDFERIKKNVSSYVYLQAQNDTAVPAQQAVAMQKELGGGIVSFVAEDDHICGGQEPTVLEHVLAEASSYPERLLNNLDTLDWPDPIKHMQRNWIGKSDGAELEFKISNSEFKISVFTTRPDTLFGATYMVLAPEHELVQKLKETIKNWGAVEDYIKEAQSKSQLERTDLAKEKTGVPLEGVTAVNPATGETIPVWIADYVLASYGTGAIMAVPAHDERDFAFATKYNLPIKNVIEPDLGYWKSDISSIEKEMQEDLNSSKTPENEAKWQEKQDKEFESYCKDVKEGKIVYPGPGKILNSDIYEGLYSTEKDAIFQKLKENSLGHSAVQHKLRDWLISRQRYWGTPIPIVYDPEGNPHPVKEEHLPLELPTDVDFKPKGTSPLGSSESYKALAEKLYGKGWYFEIDTMDTFVDSSWYFLRYTDAHNDKVFASPEALQAWLPVDTYVGGAEHAVLHLMYARFFCMALHDLGHLSFEEPFIKLRNQGLIMGPDGQKMSKSRGNVINPDEVIENLGADTMRLYEMFMGPLEESKPWSTDGIIGVRRFIERVWHAEQFVVETIEDKKQSQDIDRGLHQLIKKVQEDIESFGFNTAISQGMIFINMVYKAGAITQAQWDVFLTVLHPFAPHITNELWEKRGHTTLLEKEDWPTYDESLLVEDEVTYVIQVNGKVRANIVAAANASESDIVAQAQAEENVQHQLQDKKIVKQIFVPGKLLNFVVK